MFLQLQLNLEQGVVDDEAYSIAALKQYFEYFLLFTMFAFFMEILFVNFQRITGARRHSIQRRSW